MWRREVARMLKPISCVCSIPRCARRARARLAFTMLIKMAPRENVVLWRAALRSGFEPPISCVARHVLTGERGTVFERR